MCYIQGILPKCHIEVLFGIGKTVKVSYIIQFFNMMYLIFILQVPLTLPSVFYKRAKTRNPLLFWHFFCSGSDKTNFDALFWMHYLYHFCSFVVVILYISQTNWWRGKGTLQIKIIVLPRPDMEFCQLWPPERFQKT